MKQLSVHICASFIPGCLVALFIRFQFSLSRLLSVSDTCYYLSPCTNLHTYFRHRNQPLSTTYLSISTYACDASCYQRPSLSNIIAMLQLPVACSTHLISHIQILISFHGRPSLHFSGSCGCGRRLREGLRLEQQEQGAQGGSGFPLHPLSFLHFVLAFRGYNL